MDQRNTGKGGGSGYVRTHSRAALMAGFETHIFCVSKNDDTVETDFGTVRRVATPWRLRGPLLVEPDWLGPDTLAVRDIVFSFMVNYCGMSRRWERRAFTQSQLVAVNYKSVRQAMLLKCALIQPVARRPQMRH